MRDFPFLPPYVLAEELAAGRPVVDVHPGAEATQVFDALGMRGIVVLPPRGWIERRPAGAAAVVHAPADALPVRAGAAGAVLCANFSLLDAGERERFVAEAHRILADDGVLLATLPSGASPTLLAPPAEPVDALDLQRSIRRHFPHIALVAQTPFLGFQLRRLAQVGDPGDLVLSSALGAEEDPVAHIAICTTHYRRFDANHIIQLKYLPFDEAVRGRIDELADLAEAARWEQTRAQAAFEKARAEATSFGKRAHDADEADRELAALRASSAAADKELAELRAKTVVQERALAAAAGGRQGATARAAEAEEAARDSSQGKARERKRAEGAVAALENAQRELHDQGERLARIQHALDDREEALALARDERDRMGREKMDAERRAAEGVRALEAARATALDADARARGAGGDVDTLRTRVRDAEGAQDAASARAEDALRRLQGLEEELRLARADARRAREDLDAARAEAESKASQIDGQRRELAVSLDRSRAAEAGRERELHASLEARDEMIRELRASLEARSAGSARLDEEREVLRRQLADGKRVLVDAEARTDAAEEAVRSLRRRLEDHERLVAERDDLAEKLAEATTRVASLESESEGHEAATRNQRAMLDGMRHETRDAARLLATLEAEKERLLAQLSQREDATVELQGVLEDSRKDAEDKSRELERAVRELDVATRRVEATERQVVSMRDAHEWEAASWQGERERLEKEVAARAARLAAVERDLESAREASRSFQERAAQASHDAAVHEQEVRRRTSTAQQAAVTTDALEKTGAELRTALADEKARAAKAIEETVKKEAVLETLSDAVANGRALRRLALRLVAAAPRAEGRLAEEVTSRMDAEPTRRADEPTADEPTRRTEEPTAPEARPIVPHPRGRVLVFEAEGDARSEFEGYLRLQGWDVVPVSVAEAAMEALEAGGIDVAVVDLHGPPSGGIPLLRAIRSSAAGEVRIVVLSAALRPESPEAQGLRLSAVLPRPSALRDTAAAVARALEAPLPEAPPARAPVPAVRPSPASEPAPPPAPAPRPTAPARRPAVHKPPSASGDLATTSMAELLARFHAQSATGRLRLVIGTIAKEIWLRSGTPVSVTSSLREETLGRHLVRQRVLDEDRFEALRSLAAQRGVRLGEVLLSEGVLSPNALYERIQEHMIQKIVRAFAWTEGRWELYEQDDPVEAAALIRMEVPPLILAGVRVHMDVEHLARRCPLGPGARPEPRKTGDDLPLGPDGRRFLAGLRKGFTVGEVATEIGKSFEWAHRYLYALHVLEVVRLDPARDDRSTPAPAASPTTAATREREEVSGLYAIATTPRDAGTILADYLRLRGKDHFTVLGVSPDAPIEEIQGATERWKLRLGPLGLPKDLPAGVREAADALLASVNAAWTTLSDPLERVKYARRVGAVTVDPARAAQDAERELKEARRLLGLSRPADAVVALRLALKYAPGEPTYAAELAAALLLADPAANRKEIETLAGQARKAAPDLATPWFVLGKLALLDDNQKKAEPLLKRSLDLDPLHVDTQRELRLLAMRSPKKK